MKKGKSLITVLTAATIAACAFTLSACGNTTDYDIGVVSGNYGAAATSEQVDSAMQTISQNAPFGDTEAADWSYGLNIKANLGITANFPEMTAPDSIFMKTSNLGISTDYSLSLTNSAEESDIGFDIKGSGSLSVNATADGEKTNFNANMYNDSSYAYLHMAAIGYMPETKVKISFQDIMNEIGGMLPPDSTDPDVTEPDPGTDIETDLTPVDLLGSLTELGFDVYIDESDGLKIKMSATEESFAAILEQAGMSDPDAVRFNQSVFDVYFSLDADGNFEKFGIKIGINLSATVVAATETSAAQVAAIGISCGFALTPFNGTITMPNDLNEYISME